MFIFSIMVCETKPDEVETLVIIGKQKTRYKMLLDHNCTIKQLDEKLQNLQFTSQPNFEIKICLVDDDPHVDYEVTNITAISNFIYPFITYLLNFILFLGVTWNCSGSLRCRLEYRLENLEERFANQ